MSVKSIMTFCVVFGLVCSLVLTGGCANKGDYDNCMRRNSTLLERIAAFESDQANAQIRADRIAQQYEQLLKMKGLEKDKIAALQAALKSKNALLEQLSQQIGQPALPPELNTALPDWAEKSGSEFVTFDEERGIVRFKSDLLFAPGQDTVQTKAKMQLVSLAKILKSPAAEAFDILVVGHTDDQPIRASVARHPTNWHLSAHRAISVQKIIAGEISESRTSVMGMGEFHPVSPNKADKKGNPKNRRVEIYIVPAGQIRIDTGA